ncbi:MAG: OsmC family protein [Candidatus Eremiobacteraeota bacterium]|nr:OsmC family protein [Candidatus Eremiobacteraeota bacterium]
MEFEGALKTPGAQNRMKHAFHAKVEWTGASAGPAKDYRTYSREYTAHVEGKPPVRGSADRLFYGDAGLHNPEDMLVIALSACHLLSYLAECARSGIEVLSYTDEADGSMEPVDGVTRFTRVTLRPNVVVRGDLQKARALHDRSHDLCFIANSVNFPVLHEPSVELFH